MARHLGIKVPDLPVIAWTMGCDYNERDLDKKPISPKLRMSETIFLCRHIHVVCSFTDKVKNFIDGIRSPSAIS